MSLGSAACWCGAGALPACSASRGIMEVVCLFCLLGRAHPCTWGWCSSFSPSIYHSQGHERHLFPHMLSCLLSTWPENEGECHLTAPAAELVERGLFQKGHCMFTDCCFLSVPVSGASLQLVGEACDGPLSQLVRTLPRCAASPPAFPGAPDVGG